MKDKKFLQEHGVDIEKSLEIFGDMETYNTNIGEFLYSITEKLEKLENYLQQKDFQNYAIYAHSLKSDAKNFGFQTLETILSSQEEKSKVGDIYYLKQNISNLKSEVAKASQLIKEYLSTDSLKTSQETIPDTQLPTEYSKKTILVVDDSNIIRNFVKKIFADTYDVGTAKDGEEAINIIKANINNDNIISILLDLNMPKVNGFTVLDYMQENNLLDSIPVSIISGDSSKETIDRAFKYNIVDMLEKPFNEDNIKRIVEKTIVFKKFNQ